MRGAGLLCLTAVVGCLSPDPNHCANRGGNAACAELGFAPHCSICEHVDAGCVANVPSDACYHAGEPVATDPSDASSSAMTAEETTGPPPACASMGLDPDCPQDSPYCIDGTCGTCDSADASYCASADPDTPVCHADWGRCVGCMGDADCEDGACSPALTCVACFRHDQCNGSACDLEEGECIPTSARIWVDDGGCGPPQAPSVDPGQGTESDPYCWIGTALADIPQSGVGAILLAQGGTAIEEDLRVTMPKTVAIIGAGRTIADVDVGLTVGGAGARVYLQGLNFARTTEVGVECSFGGRVWLDNSDFTEMDRAIAADDCTIVMRRSAANDIVTDAVVVTGGTRLRMETTAVVAGLDTTPGAVGVRAEGAELDIVYSTLLGGGGDASIRALSCDAASSGAVRNSVLAGVGGDSVGCVDAVFETNVVDTAGLGESNTVFEQLDPLWFANLGEYNVHLDLTAPFADIAVWQLNDPVFDLDNDRRSTYPGLTEYAGADQP